MDRIELGGSLFAKSDERLIYGVVYEPNSVDLQEEWCSPETLKASAHEFLRNGRIFVEHKTPLSESEISIAESYIAPTDTEVFGKSVKRGSWLLVAKVHSNALWDKVRSGEYFRGWSLAGVAKRTSSKELVGMSISECSLVKHPASGIRFLALKSADNGWRPEELEKILKSIEVMENIIDAEFQKFRAKRTAIRGALGVSEVREAILKADSQDEMNRVLMAFCTRFEEELRELMAVSNQPLPIQHATRGCDDVDQASLRRELRDATEGNRRVVDDDNRDLYRRWAQNRTE